MLPNKSGKKKGENSASNGGVMRTSILGCSYFMNINQLIDNTKMICRTTHYDVRCVISCLTVTLAIANMLRGEFKFESDRDFEELTKQVCTIESFTKFEHLQDFNQHVMATNLESLNLQAGSLMGYTFKPMGAACWALKIKDPIFEDIITKLVLEGGDADTNAAVCGAVLGCKIGYKKLPNEWIQGLIHKEWLSEKIQKLLNLLDL